MWPIGPLMWEHRLIERMISVMKAKTETMRAEGSPDPVFIDTAADFFRTYADRCHHGKEEDILFQALESKSLSSEHGKIVQELMEDHKFGRARVRALLEAKEAFVGGDTDAFKEIMENLHILINFYPKHIRKEDKVFFFPCMEYFSSEEKDHMLKEFHDFDSKLIQEKYEDTVLSLENKIA